MRKDFTYTFGELIDKLTIVSKKDLCNLPGARNELNTIMSWLEKSLGEQAYLLLSIIRVAQSNMDIWNREHKLRNASEGEIPLHIVGKVAIEVREINKTRVRYKNELDTLCGANHVEEKIKHLSEEVYDKYYRRINGGIKLNTLKKHSKHLKRKSRKPSQRNK